MSSCRWALFWLAFVALAAAVAADSVTYTYDDLGRPIKAHYSSGIYIEYSYDEAGNLVSRVAEAGEPVVYVSGDGLCNGKLRCYSSVQAGVNAAQNGDTVKVADGVYPENVVMQQNKAIQLICGYNSDFTELISSADDSENRTRQGHDHLSRREDGAGWILRK